VSPQASASKKAPTSGARKATDGGATFYIREVADAVGVSPSVIRDWERQGLISPARGANGYRLYSYEDVGRARQIRDLVRGSGLNAAGVRRVLGLTENGTGNDGAHALDGDGIGRRIRRLRRQQGISLRGLAAKTGLAASHISAIERSMTRPSMASGVKLAEALGVGFLELIGSKEANDENAVVRRDDRLHPTVDFPGMQIDKLNRHGDELDAHMMTILPGLGSEGSYAHAGEEFIFVLSGQLEFTLDETETYMLGAEDTISFRSSRPHRWRNPGPEDAIVIWVDLLPNGHRA
jgi:DNA-binding transcriptional MerR regulator/quercetin dioxygenase-like cupin family protein